jgi:hypothetical protein
MPLCKQSTRVPTVHITDEGGDDIPAEELLQSSGQTADEITRVCAPEKTNRTPYSQYTHAFHRYCSY